jgi:hypothetical protein
MEIKSKALVCSVWLMTVTLAAGQVILNEASKENILALDQLKTEPVNFGYSF